MLGDNPSPAFYSQYPIKMNRGQQTIIMCVRNVAQPTAIIQRLQEAMMFASSLDLGSAVNVLNTITIKNKRDKQ